MRILISGGPGSGCTTTGSALGKMFGVGLFDSDRYFHKPTDPPFQEQYSSEERRALLGAALASESSWILSGSVSTWGLEDIAPTHGVFLGIPKEERLRRLKHRQRSEFGSRIDPGGDMEHEHLSFLEWASEYESRTGPGRNVTTDRSFLEQNCPHTISLTEICPLPDLVASVVEFLEKTDEPGRTEWK